MSLVARHAGLLLTIAHELGVEARALRALIRVEAGTEGLCDGRPIIRLEVHRLWLGVPRALRPQVDARFAVRGPRPWEGHEILTGARQWVALHQPGPAGQALEWEALGVARAIDDKAAIEATSWGAGQVLGVHWRALGFATPAAFASVMHSESEQLQAMARLLRDVVGAVPSLAARDWAEVARRYNGPGQVEWYAARLEAAYARG